MTAKTKSLIRDTGVLIVGTLMASAVCGGFAYYESASDTRTEDRARLTTVEQNQRDQRQQLIDFGVKLDRVAEDTAFIRGQMEHR